MSRFHSAAYRASRQHTRRRGSSISAKTPIRTVEEVLGSYDQYAEALLSLFSRSNSIFAGQDVSCRTSDITPVACTDGETIFFNKDTIGAPFRQLNDIDKALKSLRSIRGVNLHELAHILYSPRKTSTAWKAVSVYATERSEQSNPHLGTKPPSSMAPHTAWNLLEDQRIETLFSSRFRNSIPYFQATITELILEQRYAKPHLFHLWLYGRRYIPQDIRNLARTVFVEHYKVTNADLLAFEETIDDYRSFVFPRNGKDVVPLLKKFLALWDKYIPSTDYPPNHGNGDINGSGGHSERKEGTPSVTEQKEAQQSRIQDEADEADKANKADKADEETEAEADEETEAEEATESEATESEELDEETGSQVAQSHDNSDDKYSDDKYVDDGTGGYDLSDPLAPKPHVSETEYNITRDTTGLCEAMQNSIVESSAQVKEELAKTLRQAIKLGKSRHLGNALSHIEAPVALAPTPNVYKAVSNAIDTSLRTLRSDNEAMWDKGTPTGRLNFDRLIQSEATDSDMDIFDSWKDSGDDSPRVEIIVLLDQSSSMDTTIPMEHSTGLVKIIDEASASVWAIKSACQKNEIPCTVIGYSGNNETMVLYRSTDTVPLNKFGAFMAKSSTSPSDALRLAEAIFASSEAHNKILISISDGEWANVTHNTALVYNLGRQGVDTILVALPTGYAHPRNMPYWDENGNAHPDTKVVPYFSDAYEKEVYFTDSSGKSRFAVLYGHKALLKCANPLELAKKIGKVIISASK